MTSESNVSRNPVRWYSREFRALSVARQVESGWNAAAFCRQEGISSKTFYRWRRLARSDSRSGLVLAPVTVRPDAPVRDAASHQVELELHLKNGRCVQARVPAASLPLRCVLEALEGLS